MTRLYLGRRAFLGAALAGVLGGAAVGQGPGDPYRTVEPVALPLDRQGVYTLNFRYAPPRIIKLDLPDKGRQYVWYMFYQVYNKTDLPQEFIPEFELVTKDLNDPKARFYDEPRPSAVAAIRKIEDPTGALDLQTTVSISKKKIPLTNPDSFPRYVSGIAVWTDVPEKAARTNRFSVYVTGLSNGVVTVEQPDGSKVIRRKVLRLDFFKPTDDIDPGAGDIKIEDNGGLGGEKWDYRSTTNKPAEKK
jgi:hypothetical protein